MRAWQPSRSARSRRTTGAAASTTFFRRRFRASSTRRGAGGSTRAARRSGCRARSSSPSNARRRRRRPSTRLRIQLKHQGAVVGQALGRFRLSVTSSSTPQRIVEIPAKLRPILSIAAADRTEQQRKDLAALYRTVAPSLKPARDRIAELQRSLRALGIPTALVMRERVAYERPSAYVRRRGSFLDKGQQVYAGVPEFLHPLGDDQMPNRLGLARWLVDEENPLTARVAVNRAWEQLFGRGIVETGEDFGTQGSPPSHPELFDWLATELVRQKWHTKALHKLIVIVGDLPAVVGCVAGRRGGRPVQPPAGPRPALPHGCRNGTRFRARRGRIAQPQDRRAERVSAAARGHLGHSLQQREVDAEPGGGSVPARPLRRSFAGRRRTRAS